MLIPREITSKWVMLSFTSTAKDIRASRPPIWYPHLKRYISKFCPHSASRGTLPLERSSTAVEDGHRLCFICEKGPNGVTSVGKSNRSEARWLCLALSHSTSLTPTSISRSFHRCPLWLGIYHFRVWSGGQPAAGRCLCCPVLELYEAIRKIWQHGALPSFS